MDSKSSTDAMYEKLMHTPGMKFDPNKHKRMFDTLTDAIIPIFEQVIQHPENTTRFKLKKKSFLGAHPVSLEKKYLKEMLENTHDYLVCEKTDGIRYMMIVSNYGEVFLAGRDEDFYLINLPSPQFYKKIVLLISSH